MTFKAIALQDGVYFPAKPVFEALRASNYSQWARVGGVVKIPIPTAIDGHSEITDMLPALELYRVVFGSRSANALAVQTALLKQSLSGFAVGTTYDAASAPARTQVCGPVHAHAPVQQPTAKPARHAKEIDSRVAPLLEALSKTVPAKATYAKECIERAAVKGHIPDAAWITFQYDQIAAIVTDEVATMSEFKSLKAERDPDAKW